MTDLVANSRNVFVGRGHELGEFLTVLEHRTDSQCPLILISGEPGIGKTRLAEEMAVHARARGIRAVWGRCWEGEGAPPYWPWTQIIRACFAALEPDRRRMMLESELAPTCANDVARIVPELRLVMREMPRGAVPTQLDGEQARLRLFDSIASVLKSFATGAPMLIVVDDLQDGDPASLMLLRFVARETVGASILLVGTYRDAEVQRSRLLSEIVGELNRDSRPMPLAGLVKDEVAELIERTGGRLPNQGLVEKVYTASNGNPLFIEGIVRLLAAHGQTGLARDGDITFRLPGGLREAIRLRLNRLTKQTYAILSVAAALGNEFEGGRCRTVARVSADNAHQRFDEACRAGIVTALGHGRYRFSHALIREALYEDTDISRRVALHRKIGAAIEREHLNDLQPHLDELAHHIHQGRVGLSAKNDAPIKREHLNDLQPHMYELAHHFSQAGIAPKAIDYSIRAADAAGAGFSLDTALFYLERALAVAQAHGAGAATRAEILSRLGPLRYYIFNNPGGLEDTETAISLYLQAGKPEQTRQLRHLLGLAYLTPGLGMNVSRGLSHYREAEALADEEAEPEAAAEIYFGLALGNNELLQLNAALEYSARALQIYERLNMSGTLSWLLVVEVRALALSFSGKHREAIELWKTTVKTANVLSDPLFRSEVFRLNGLYHAYLLDPTEAARFYRLGLETKGLPPRIRGLLLDPLAVAQVALGQLAEAEKLCGERFSATGRAWLAYFRGDWKTARQTLEQQIIAAAKKLGTRELELNALCVMLGVLREAGEYEEASSILRQCLGFCQGGQFLFELIVRCEAILLALDSGHPQDSISHLERCREILAQGENWLGRAGFVELAEAAVAAAQNQMRNADRHFEKALATFTKYQLPFARAATLHRWGCALAAAGDCVQAAEKLDAALQIYRHHGAGQPWIDRVLAARS